MVGFHYRMVLSIGLYYEDIIAAFNRVNVFFMELMLKNVFQALNDFLNCRNDHRNKFSHF